MLELATVPTEYLVADRPADNEIVGIDAAELQVTADDGDRTDYVATLLDAVAPVLKADTHV